MLKWYKCNLQHEINVWFEILHSKKFYKVCYVLNSWNYKSCVLKNLRNRLEHDVVFYKIDGVVKNMDCLKFMTHLKKNQKSVLGPSIAYLYSVYSLGIMFFWLFNFSMVYIKLFDTIKIYKFEYMKFESKV